ncbi:MAG: hypothetical protein QXT33_01270 [Thermofilum sp.]
MHWEKILLVAAISISLILAITLLAVYLELVKIQVELLEVKEKLAAVKTDVNNVEKALTGSSVLVSTEVLLACENMTLSCGRVYTYAGSPALLPLSSCTALEVEGNGSTIRVVSVPAFGVGGNWELRICRGEVCTPSSLMQSLWGGEKLILTCALEKP